MKIWNTSGTNSTEIAHDKDIYQRQDDGSFEVPDAVFAVVRFAGFTNVNPNPVAPAAPPTGNPAQWTADVLHAEAERLGVDLTLDRPAMVSAVAAARRAEADRVDQEANPPAAPAVEG